MILSPRAKETLLRIAKESIEHGLHHQQVQTLDTMEFPSEIRVRKACFVTLYKHHELRGCIGSLEAKRLLPVDVSENAYSAAFNDLRFQPVQIPEVDLLDITLSILTPSEPMSFDTEDDLVHQLRPGIDGLIIRDQKCSATFLPSVWEQIEEPNAFLENLKVKAGLASDYWSNTLKAYRYTTVIIS